MTDHATMLVLARSGQISAQQWAAHLKDDPELAAFVIAVEARERADASDVRDVLNRCGYGASE